MEFVFRNLPVFLILPTLLAFSWIYGGSRGDLLVGTMPWFLALVFEVLLFFPQRRPYEDSAAARRRVWRKTGRDPLFWVTVLFLVIMLIPFANKGLCPACDYPAILAGADPEPPIPFSPFCVNYREHWGVLVWFLPTLAATLAARDSLTRAGKKVLFEGIVWNAALLAVLGFVQQATGAENVYWTKSGGVHFFSVFGYENMAGAFFTLAFALAVGLWQTRRQEVADLPPIDKNKGLREEFVKRLIKSNYALCLSVLLFIAAMSTLCRSAVCMTMTLAALAALYHVAALIFSRHDRARKVRQAATACIAAMVLVVVGYVFMPDELTREINSVDSYSAIERISGKSQYHTRIATEIFRKYPLFGCGGWGYKHFCRQFLTDDDRRVFQETGGINVHNDYMQFLCEHGAVGAGCLLAILLMLIVPLLTAWCKMYRSARFLKSHEAPPKPRALYCFPPGTLWTLLGASAVILHAFGDCPLRSAAVLSTFLVSLACAEGFLPHEYERK